MRVLCRKGKVKMVTSDIPQELRRLFTSKRIRMQNILENTYGISTPTSHSQALESLLIRRSAMRREPAYIYVPCTRGDVP
jgi:hypothetical protein